MTLRQISVIKTLKSMDFVSFYGFYKCLFLVSPFWKCFLDKLFWGPWRHERPMKFFWKFHSVWDGPGIPTLCKNKLKEISKCIFSRWSHRNRWTMSEKKNFNAKILIEVSKQLQGKQIENKQDLFMNQL